MIFISYSRTEEAIAHFFCASLESKNLPCWIAPRDIEAGTDYSSSIIHALNKANIVLVVLSKASERSPHVQREIERAISKKIPILPFVTEKCPLSPSMEYLLSSCQWIDGSEMSRDRSVGVLERAILQLVGSSEDDTGAQIELNPNQNWQTLRRKTLILPNPPNPLIGREREVEEITQSLSKESVRLVTLTGPGGSGKTRIALAVGHQMTGTFTDGIFFVPVSDVEDHENMANTILRTLGLREVSGRLSTEIIHEFLRDSMCLLIIDNLEQIATAPNWIASLLLCCRRLKVMATSRQPLHITGEHEYPIGPLGWSADDSQLNSEEVVCPAVALFVERASALRKSFSLTSDNYEDVLSICRRLDGLPLAIELAAAKTRFMSPALLLHKLNDWQSVLTGGAEDLPQRHKSLRDTIAWSYDLLHQEEKEIFVAVCVFNSGFTSEAASAVCSEMILTESTIDTILEALVLQSLVYVSIDGSGIRFKLLEIIREFGLALLRQSSMHNALQNKHTEFFLALSERAEPYMLSSLQSNYLNLLEMDYPNIRASLEFLISTKDVERASALVGSLTFFCVFHGHMREGWDAANLVMDTNQIGATAAEAKLLVGAAILAYFLGEHGRMGALCQQGYESSKNTGATWHEALAMFLLGVIAYVMSYPENAACMWQQSIDLCVSIEDKWVRSVSTSLLALYHLDRGDVKTSLTLSQQSLELANGPGESWTLNQAYYNYGFALIANEQLTEAAQCFMTGVVLCQKLGYRLGISLNLDGLAAVDVHRKSAERAAKLLGAAVGLRRTVGADVPAVYRGIYDRLVEAVKDAVGPEAFFTIMTSGERLSEEEAVTFAMS